MLTNSFFKILTSLKITKSDLNKSDNKILELMILLRELNENGQN